MAINCCFYTVTLRVVYITKVMLSAVKKCLVTIKKVKISNNLRDDQLVGRSTQGLLKKQHASTIILENFVIWF